jgi:hypothetical protein
MKHREAKEAIVQIFDDRNDVGIDSVFSGHFELRYDERKIIRSIESLADYLESSTSLEDLPPLSKEVRKELTKLKDLIDKVLED